jgi:hypothetical protein
MTNKTHQIGVRLDSLAWKRLEDLQRLTSLDKVAMARAAIMAMLDAADRDGEISFPLRIVSAERKRNSNGRENAASE